MVRTSVNAPDTVSTTARARLPRELWAMTMDKMRDCKSQAELAYLWTTLRRVSKGFEREIEKFFYGEHLGRTWIHADCGQQFKATRNEKSSWLLKLTGCFLGYRCVEYRTFARESYSCWKPLDGSGNNHHHSSFVDSPFGFSNLDTDDEKGAVFKYRRQFKPDDEDSGHSVIHGSLLRLSKREQEHLPLMEEAEATTSL